MFCVYEHSIPSSLTLLLSLALSLTGGDSLESENSLIENANNRTLIVCIYSACGLAKENGANVCSKNQETFNCDVKKLSFNLLAMF